MKDIDEILDNLLEEEKEIENGEQDMPHPNLNQIKEISRMSKKKYNFIEFKPDTPVVGRRTLRKGQADLYDLITKKLKTNDPVTLTEAKKIYLNKVCRNMVNGKPHSYVTKYNHNTEKWYWSLEPMTHEQLLTTVMKWLTQTIGVLVMRGYLKVIPQVRLEA